MSYNTEMNLSFALSVAVMFGGLALYVFVPASKPSEIGRLMFAFGLLVTLLRFGGQVVLHGG